MKCKIRIKELQTRIKPVFAQAATSYKNKVNGLCQTQEDIQLIQAGDDIILARKYTAGKTRKETIKTCIFCSSEDISEPLDNVFRFDYPEYFFKWLKNADDIETVTFSITDGYKCSLDYDTPCGSGHAAFQGDVVYKKQVINIGQNVYVNNLDTKLLASMKQYLGQENKYMGIEHVHIQDGVMIATDSKCMKFKVTQSKYDGNVDLDGAVADEQKYPDYKRCLPHTQDVFGVLSLDKSIKKPLETWQKCCADKKKEKELTIQMLVQNGWLKLTCPELDYDSRVFQIQQKTQMEGLKIAYKSGQLLRLLRDKDLPNYFQVLVCQKGVSMIFNNNQTTAWLQMRCAD
jgi:hypothetical protein